MFRSKWEPYVFGRKSNLNASALRFLESQRFSAGAQPRWYKRPWDSTSVEGTHTSATSTMSGALSAQADSEAAGLAVAPESRDKKGAATSKAGSAKTASHAALDDDDTVPPARCVRVLHAD